MKRVSIVIPTIGRIEYLDKSIESILNQTIPFDEIIIFDNSIEQNIYELSKHKDTKNIIWEKSGKQLDPICSWNKAVSLTSNEYVTVFGDDDIAYNEFHSTIVKNLEKADLIFLNFDVIDENGNITAKNNKDEVLYSSTKFRHLRMEGKLYTVIPGVVFKKSSFEKLNGYEDSGLPNFLYSDDLFYFKLAILEQKVHFSGKSLWKYRIHKSQIGNLIQAKKFSNSIPIYIKKLEKSLQILNVSYNEIYPKELNKKGYINKLILDRFLIVINNLYKANEIKLILQNLNNLIENNFISDFDKFNLISKIFSIKLLNNNQNINIKENYSFSIKFNKLISFIDEIKQKKSSSFALYGFGHIGKFIVDNLEDKICVIIDKDKELKEYKNINITHPNNLSNYKYDYIIISVLGREEEIEKFLIEELEVLKEKLIFIKT